MDNIELDNLDKQEEEPEEQQEQETSIDDGLEGSKHSDHRHVQPGCENTKSEKRCRRD